MWKPVGSAENPAEESMSIENVLSLDGLKPSALKRQIAQLEKKKTSLITLETSARNWEEVQGTLCSIRASGLSVLLLLDQASQDRSAQEILLLLSNLRSWDQLLLRNLLQVAASHIDAKFLPFLQQEAKIEMKWFQEWQTALTDPRIHRYPGLPWRSFLRKVNAENFAFAKALLEGKGADDRLLEDFLKSKRKTICIFPKNWSHR
jgi:hypothetical protein